VTGANGNSLTSAAKLPTNAWTQITGTFDGSQARFYLNGVLDRTLTWSGTRLTNSQALWVGYYSGSYAVSGRVDEARIYAPALSASDVNLLSQGREYTYDTNGNLTGDGSWTYNYDYENRLTKAYRGDNLGSSASAVHYTYDALGRLAERRTSGDTVTTNRMYYAGWQLIAEYNGAGTLQRKYVYGPGIDEPVRLTSGSNRFYYHADGLGSVTEITTINGVIRESYSYDVYGTPTLYGSNGVVIASTAINNRLMFTGRDRDPDTTLYNYRYRYYSPSLGRFVQVDPINLAGGDLNLYRYVGNNPVNATDPFGLLGTPEQRERFIRDMTLYGSAFGAFQGGMAGGAGGLLIGAPTGPGAAATGTAGAVAGAAEGTLIGGVSGRALGHLILAGADYLEGIVTKMSGQQGRWWERADSADDACDGGIQKMPQGNNAAKQAQFKEALRRLGIKDNTDKARRLHDAISKQGLESVDDIVQAGRDLGLAP